MFQFYVYIHHIGPHKYIGKGKGRRAFNYYHHRNPKYKAAYKKHGCIPEIIAYFSTEELAYEYEELKIIEMKTEGYSLLNLSRGGLGNKSGWKHSKEHLQKMSKKYSGIGNPFYGKKHPPEVMEKIKLKLRGRKSWSKGKKFTEEHKKKLRIAKIGHIPWNKGKKNCQVIGLETRQKLSDSIRESWKVRKAQNIERN